MTFMESFTGPTADDKRRGRAEFLAAAARIAFPEAVQFGAFLGAAGAILGTFAFIAGASLAWQLGAGAFAGIFFGSSLGFFAGLMIGGFRGYLDVAPDSAGSAPHTLDRTRVLEALEGAAAGGTIAGRVIGAALGSMGAGAAGVVLVQNGREIFRR